MIKVQPSRAALRIRTQDLNLAKSTLTLKSNRLKDDIAKLQLDLNKEGVNTMQGMVGALPQEMSGLSQQQSEDQRLYNLANSKLQQFQAQLERGEDPAEIEKELHQDQRIQMLHLKVDDAEQGMTELGSVGPNSPRAQQYQQQVVMLEKQLADAEAERRVALRAELKSQLEQEKDAAESGLQAVAQKISELKDAQGELDYKLFQFFQSKQDQEATDVQLQNIQKQIDNIENETHDKDLAGVSWAQLPSTPDTPSFPRLPITLSVAIGLGLMSSLAIAFARELMDQSVRSPRDITRVGQMNLLGMIPHEHDDPQVAGVPLALVISQAPTSVIAEQFRQVRTRAAAGSIARYDALDPGDQSRPRRRQEHGRSQPCCWPGAQWPAHPPG